MGRGTDTVAIARDAANRGDLGADLRLRQQSADARLRALTQLDFNRADLGALRDPILESSHAEAAVELAATEVARTHLPDEIAAMEMMARDAALARVLPTPGELGAEIQRFDRRTAERTEAHAGDVDDRWRPEGFRAPARAAEHF